MTDPAPSGADSAARSLRGNVSWNVIGTLGYALSQWAILIVLARLGSSRVVGQFTLALAFCTPALMLTNLQLRNVQVTDTRDEYAFSDYVGLRLIMSLLALLCIATAATFGTSTRDTLDAVLLMGLAKAIEAVGDVFHGFLHKRERLDIVGRSLLLRGVLSIGTVGGAFAATNSLNVSLLALSAGWLAVLVAHDIPYCVRLARKESPEHWRELLKPRWSKRLYALTWLALPLGIARGLIALRSSVPRFFLEAHIDTESVGIFASMAYITVAAATVTNAIGFAALPRLARYRSTGEKNRFWHIIGVLALTTGGFGLATVLGAMVLGREVLLVLYGAEYAVHADVFTWVLVGGTIGYLAASLNHGLTAMRGFRSQLVVFSFSVAVGTGAAMAWIPTHGLMGGVYSLIAASSTQLVASLGAMLLLERLKSPHVESESSKVDPSHEDD